MKKFLEEFKTFAMKGNMIDLAVGVVIGGAFSKIVTMLVECIITPLIALVLGAITGQSSTDALFGSWVVGPFPTAPTTKKCPYCKSEIDIDATRCPHCTSEL